MQVNLTHHSPTRKSIEVTVPASEVSAAFGEVIARLAPNVKIPGFRPGKAPKDVLISRYDREIQAEVAEALVKRHFFAAAQAAGTQPVQQQPQRRPCCAGGKAILCQPKSQSQPKGHQCPVQHRPAAGKADAHRCQPPRRRAQHRPCRQGRRLQAPPVRR